MVGSTETDLKLTRQHFSTKIYRAYLHYLRTRHPEIDLEELCQSAGLPYSYVANELNWVSVIFDRKFTELCIQRTGNPRLCYQVGEQVCTAGVLGTTLYLFGKYALSVDFLYAQAARITPIFSRVTRMVVLRSHKGKAVLRFEATDEGLDEEEKEALRGNFRNILENTLGYLVAVPSLKGLPPGRLEYRSIPSASGLPSVEIRVEYEISGKLARYGLLAAFTLPLFPGALWLSRKLDAGPWTTFWLALSALLIGMQIVQIFSYLRLRTGFLAVIRAFRELDQRYLALHEAQEELQELSDGYRRFVPFEFLQLLQRTSVTEVNLGDQVEKEITVLFADIRDFTGFSEGLTPQECFELLNSYLARIAPVIERHAGFIDKYMGDGLMAIFPGNPKDAILAGVEMLRELEAFNRQREAQGQFPIKIVIGVNTGRGVLGTVGYREQMRGTAIGDSVNTASRIERLAKKFSAPLLVSRSAIEKAGLTEEVANRYLGALSVDGRKHPVDVHEVFEAYPGKTAQGLRDTLSIFNRGVELISKNRHSEAAALFLEVVERNPGDQVAVHYLELIEAKTGIRRLRSAA